MLNLHVAWECCIGHQLLTDITCHISWVYQSFSAISPSQELRYVSSKSWVLIFPVRHVMIFVLSVLVRRPTRSNRLIKILKAVYSCSGHRDARNALSVLKTARNTRTVSLYPNLAAFGPNTRQNYSCTIASTIMLKILGDTEPPCVAPRCALKGRQ